LEHGDPHSCAAATLRRDDAARERTVGQLGEPFVISFAAASKHVKVLERAGAHATGVLDARLAPALFSTTWLNIVSTRSSRRWAIPRAGRCSPTSRRASAPWGSWASRSSSRSRPRRSTWRCSNAPASRAGAHRGGVPLAGALPALLGGAPGRPRVGVAARGRRIL